MSSAPQHADPQHAGPQHAGPQFTGLQHEGPLAAVQSVVSLIVVAIFIVSFTTQPFQIPSGSMEPTLLIGDFLLVNKQLVPSPGLEPPATIHRGDIVVFHYPVEPSLDLVKRVIGVPGDRLRLRAGRVIRNGQPIDEPYAFYRPSPPDSFRDNFPRMQSAEPGVDAHWWIEMRRRIDQGDLVVPPGQYFVLGDNRNDSEDSRFWGFVPAAAIVGKPMLIYFSLREPEREGQATKDPTTTAQVSGPLPPSVQPKLLDRIVMVARWSRILHVVH